MPSDYDQIRADNIKEYGEGTRHLSFLGRLYTDRTHFVFELLQNAEDAGASRILFRLLDDRLEVTHDGRPFNELDVRGVCGVGEGTKAEDLTQIGKFGIGFKSVYAYTSKPEVHSGDESFRIENYVRPYAVERRKVGDSWTTLFAFAFHADSFDPETACREIGARLRNLSARTLLFLRKIDEIEYKLPDLTGGVYLREEVERGPARQVTVIGQNNGMDEDENWLIFERPVPVPDCSNQVRVEVGFRLETSTKNKTESITKIKDAPLVVYFPTEKATRFGFLIQGPYRTTPSRDNIPKDDAWNATLVAETSILVNDTLRDLKEMGLLSGPLLEAMPIRMDDFPEGSMFYPIVGKVREALMKEELLPADDGTFVSARNAKLASAEWLRTLLPDEQLRQLFRTEKPFKWICAGITERTEHDLWKYIREELKVDEITPDSFARKIEGSFLEKQTDDWMIAFYEQLIGQEALWKKGRNSWSDKARRLRAKQFIRLQGGSHVMPFRDDDSPNVYLPPEGDTESPIVRRSIAKDEKALEFLKMLGLTEPGPVAEVIDRIIPKYTQDQPHLSDDEHLRHMKKILRAFSTDSIKEKEQLINMLKDTAFICAENPVLQQMEYRKPHLLYAQKKELRLYFKENRDAWFISSKYDASFDDLFKDLGIHDVVYVKRKTPNRKRHVVIANAHGKHKHGLNGFDPSIEVDGLEHALTHPTIERSFERNLFIWNHIAVANADCIRGIIESSKRQTYEDSTSKQEISGFGKLLIDAAWLPGSDGKMHKPSELTLDDLPESFVRNERVADQLDMKKDVVAKLAEEIGIPIDVLEFAKQNPEKVKQLMADKAQRKKPAFPERASSNPDRRREKIVRHLGAAPSRKYESRTRSVRITEATPYTRTWLRNQYKNEAGQMICQVCKEEMPFRKRDGEYYFEAVEALSRDHFIREHEAQFLALCPLCAARYKEFVRQDEGAMVDLKNALMNADDSEVPLRLGELDTSIRFVETHYHDIKTILEEQE